MEKTDKKHPWILAGYAHFAQHGPKDMKVDALAPRAVRNADEIKGLYWAGIGVEGKESTLSGWFRFSE